MAPGWAIQYRLPVTAQSDAHKTVGKLLRSAGDCPLCTAQAGLSTLSAASCAVW